MSEFQEKFEAKEAEEALEDGISSIEERAASNMPETFSALRKSVLFSTAFSHGKRDFVKFKLFATVVKPDDETKFYNPVVLEYAGKILALQLVSPGIDYWASQEVTVSVTGTEEQISFLDRVKMLLEMQKRLWAECEELLPLVEQTVIITPMSKARPHVTPGEDKTSDPQLFGKEYRTAPWFSEWEVGPWE